MIEMIGDVTTRDLIDIAAAQFDRLEEMPDTDDLLNEYPGHYFHFDVKDVEDYGFMLQIDDGDISVYEGRESTDIESVNTFRGDARTLHAVLTGETTIVDETWEGNLQARVYSSGMRYTSWLSRILKRIRESGDGQ